MRCHERDYSQIFCNFKLYSFSESRPLHNRRCLYRNIVGGVLIGLGGAATLVMLALAPPGGEPDGTDNQQEEKKGPIKVKFYP